MAKKETATHTAKDESDITVKHNAVTLGLAAVGIIAIGGLAIVLSVGGLVGMFGKSGDSPRSPAQVRSPNALRLDTELTVAVKNNSLDEVQSLLKEGANPNSYGNCQGSTPLFQAYLVGNLEIIEALQEKGATPLCESFKKLLIEKYEWKTADFQ